MEKLNPWRTGAVLAITMGISYSVCAALYALWPERGIEFLNALFHGLDFQKLTVFTPFQISMFYYPLVVLVLWGFGVGALFAGVNNLFRRGPAGA